MIRLAIVIVSFNAREDLARTLASLRDAPPATPHQIVVVDNGSTDGAPVMVRERFPAVRVLDAGGNLGFARANNLGIRASSGELVLLLNPDTAGALEDVDRASFQIVEVGADHGIVAADVYVETELVR